MSKDFIGLDAIEGYALALDADISAEVCNVVQDGKLIHGWAGTVYGKMVATERGYRFPTYAEAVKNASGFVMQCASIVSERKSRDES